VTNRQTAIAPGEFWTEYDFNEQAIVLDEQLEIDVPAERHVTLKTREGFDAATAEAAGRRIYRWQRSHLAINRDDDKSDARPKKPRDAEPPAIRLTTFADWHAVGRWYRTLEAPQRTPTPDIRRKAAELTAGRKSDMEKLQALYDFVSQNFRYV